MFQLKTYYKDWNASPLFISSTVVAEHELNEEVGGHHTVEGNKEANGVPEVTSSNNLTLTSPMETREEQKVLDEVHSTPDITVEEDGGHFNKNKDNQMHKGSQAALENPLDMGLDVEVEHAPSGW